MLATPRKCKTWKPRSQISLAAGSHDPSRWAGCIGLIAPFKITGTEELCVPWQVAGSDSVVSVKCNVWCWGIGVHTVCISGIFFLKLIPVWLHGLNACLCWCVLLVLQLNVQFYPKGIQFIHSRTTSWCTVTGYSKEVCFTCALLSCTKKLR